MNKVVTVKVRPKRFVMVRVQGGKVEVSGPGKLHWIERAILYFGGIAGLSSLIARFWT